MNYLWTTEDNSKLIINMKNDIVKFVIKSSNKDDIASIIKFTDKEFSSFVCELVKYLLKLPEVARSIPFYASCAASAERPHGVIGIGKIENVDEDPEGDFIIKFGDEYAAVRELWERYHGIEVGDDIVFWMEENGIYHTALNTKANIIQDCEPRWKNKKFWYTKVE